MLINERKMVCSSYLLVAWGIRAIVTCVQKTRGRGLWPTLSRCSGVVLAFANSPDSQELVMESSNASMVMWVREPSPDPSWSKYYLPTTLATITARFHSFQALKLSYHETLGLPLWNPCFPALKLPLCQDLSSAVFRTWRIVRIFPITTSSCKSLMSLVIKVINVFWVWK